MLLVGELVLTRNQIVQHVGALQRHRPAARLAAAQPHRQRAAGGRHEDAHAADRPRLVASCRASSATSACSCGKPIRLEMEGRETELDKTLLEAIKDPLTHLVRNSVDHGIETPRTARAAGKPAEGVLTLRAHHEGGQVVVEVADDGAGIDPAKIGAKARRARPGHPDAAGPDEPDATSCSLIFLPGFSTAAQVTNVSGRGVGMDVVKTNIEAIGGTIEVESVPGEGTDLPAAHPADAGDHPGADRRVRRRPLRRSRRSACWSWCASTPSRPPPRSSRSAARRSTGSAASCCRWSGSPSVARACRSEPATTATSVIVVLQSEGRRFGLVVDRVIDTEEIVVKPSAASSRASASTPAPRSSATARSRSSSTCRPWPGARCAPRPPSGSRRARPPRPRRRRRDRAAADAARRDRRRPAGRHPAGHRHPARAGPHRRGREGRQPRGRAVPRRDPADRPARPAPGRLRRDRPRACSRSSSTPTTAAASAIVVEEILDIVDGEAAVRSDIDDMGLLGSAVLGDKVTELLDVRAAILAADPAFYAAPHATASRRRPASPTPSWRSDVPAPTDTRRRAGHQRAAGHLPARRRPLRRRGRARAGGAASSQTSPGCRSRRRRSPA